MIRIDKGTLEIRGDIDQLHNETCKLLHKLAKQEIIDKDTMHFLVEVAFMSEEELIQAVREVIDEKEEKTEEDRVMSELLDTMETLFNFVNERDK